jgi:hypothetical protein
MFVHLILYLKAKFCTCLVHDLVAFAAGFLYWAVLLNFINYITH